MNNIDLDSGYLAFNLFSALPSRDLKTAKNFNNVTGILSVTFDHPAAQRSVDLSPDIW